MLLITIVLGVGLFMGVLTLSDSAQKEFNRILSRATGDVDIVISNKVNVTFSEKIAENLSQRAEVAGICTRLLLPATFYNESGYPTSGFVCGIEPGDYLYAFLKVNGSSALRPGSVVVSEYMAEILQIEVNDTLRVSVFPTERTHSANLNLTVVGVFELPPFAFQEAYMAFVNKTYLQSVVGGEGLISRVYIRLKDFGMAESFAEELEKELGPDYEVLAPRVEISSTLEERRQGFQYSLTALCFTSFLVCTVLVLCVFMTAVEKRVREIGILRSIGASRWQVFSALLGESMLLSAMGTAIGLILGIVLAKVLLELIYVLFGIRIRSFVVTIPSLTYSTVVGLAIGFLGGFYPAWWGSRVDIVKALRPIAGKTHAIRYGAYLTVGGAALSALCLFIMGGNFLVRPDISPALVEFLIAVALIASVVALTGVLRIIGPIVGRIFSPISRPVASLASKNLSRNLIRAAFCLGVLMAIILIIIIGGGYRSSIKQSINQSIVSLMGKTDVVVECFLNPPTRQFANNLSQVEGVKTVCPFFVFAGKSLTAYNPYNYSLNASVVPIVSNLEGLPIDLEVENMTLEEAVALMRSNDTYVIIVDETAARLNVTRWDRIVLPTRYGLRNFTVCAILKVKPSMVAYAITGFQKGVHAMFVSYDCGNKYFMPIKDLANAFLIDVVEGYSPSDVRDEILDLYGSQGSAGHYVDLVFTVDDLLEEVGDFIDRIFMIYTMLFVFVALAGLIGITTIFLLNVSERKYEIGVLRSQGMSKTQVVGTIVLEAVLLAVIASIFGVPLGIYALDFFMRYISVRGFPMVFVFPWEAVVTAVVIAIGMSVLASAYPSRRVAGMTVVEAIRGR